MFKKFTLYALVATLSLQTVTAALPANGGDKGSQTRTEAKAQKKQMQTAMMQKITQMSVRDYEQMSGKKMTLGERISFKVLKMRMKKDLRKGNKGLFDDFNVGGFLLGLFLSIIGVLLAYIFSRDSNLHKWSWIGLGVSILLSLLLFI